jgi:ubiquinone/menaquinone biosynthesis C-methylase UbiE
MLDRVLEPEVMESLDEAIEYNEMDHGAVNRNFVTDLLAAGPIGTDCLDLGTGTALIPIELCKRHEDVRVMAADASTAMLELARYQLEINNLITRIQLHCGDAKKLVFESSFFDTVISNSLVHHLPSHETFLTEALRVLRPNGLLFIRDLCRPDSQKQLDDLVAIYAINESEHSRQMLRQSLHAALSLSEIRELAVRSGLSSDCVTMTSDRHWTLQARKG